MVRPLRVQYEGAFYHIITRGQRRESIFKDNHDREEFLERLSITVSKYGVLLHAYCLMDNHYHLLIETPKANLSQAMRYFNGSYANYFRIRHKLIGSIFQGRYKSIVVEKEDYLLQLSAYIHLNPVRAKMVKNPENYKWSSFRFYFGNEEIPEFLHTQELRDRYGEHYIEHVYEIMGMSAEELDDILETKNSVIGSEMLRSYVIECAEQRRGVDQDIEVPEFAQLKRNSKEKVFQALIGSFNITMEDILSTKRGNVFKKLAIYGLKRYTGLKVKEIGDIFGLQYHAISVHDNQIRKKFSESDELKKMKDIFDKKMQKTTF